MCPTGTLTCFVTVSHTEGKEDTKFFFFLLKYSMSLGSYTRSSSDQSQSHRTKRMFSYRI